MLGEPGYLATAFMSQIHRFVQKDCGESICCLRPAKGRLQVPWASKQAGSLRLVTGAGGVVHNLRHVSETAGAG